MNKVRFLRHIISAEGVAVDPNKVASVIEWETPKNAGDIRSFLELAGYYRRFIENFSKIVSCPKVMPQFPFWDLLKKGLWCLGLAQFEESGSLVITV
jgi:hypothetical protein